MFRNQVAALLENTPLVFSIPLQGEDYETQIARAYDHGATHIAIGGLPFEYDALLPDNSDPYPNWSQGNFSLFRVFPPEGVAEHMPNGMIERNRAYLDSRIAAIRRHGMAQLRQRGVSHSIALGVTTSRWLVRPLVPEPMKLTDEETAHYRGMLFSCDPPEEDANLCNILGKPVFIGDSVVWMARWCIDEAQSHLQAALALVDRIPQADDPESTERLALYRARIEALHLVCECGRLAILYQHALNTAHIPRFGANPLDFDDNILFDQRVLELRKIARMDLDNTLELIELLRRFEVNEVLAQATDPARETVFIYGPDLIDKLEKKRSVMLRHWHDYERLFPTSKRYELEPTPRDQPGRGLHSGELD